MERITEHGTAEASADPAAGPRALFAGESDAARRCRAVDWAATPLGPVDGWAPSLRAATRLLLDSPVAMSLWCGPDYTLVYNDAYRRVLGAKHPAALGRPGAEAWEELWGEIGPLVAGVRAGGPPVAADDVPFAVVRQDGGEREPAWFSYALSPVRDAGAGDPAAPAAAVLSVVTETTERVLAERRLAAQAADLGARVAEAERERRRVAGVLESISDAFFALDRDWCFTYVNDRAEQVLARRRDSLLGRRVWDEFPEAVGSTFEREYRRALETGAAVAFEEFFPPLDCWFDVHAYPGGDGLAVYFQDVTPRRRAALAAAAAQRRAAFAGDVGLAITAGGAVDDVLQRCCQAAVDHLGAAFARAWVAEPDEPVLVLRASAGLYTHLDGAHARVPVGELKIGQIAADRRPHVTNAVVGDPRVPEQAWAAREGLVAFAGYPLVVGEDVVGVFALFARAALDEADVHAFGTAATAVSLAVSNARLLASEQAAREAAEAANRAKGSFLATMSHELRTPLNAIGGYAELLELGIRGPVTEAQRRDLARIQQSQRHLLGLVNEVLDLATVDAGELHVERAEMRAGDTVDAALALVRPQAAAKALTLVDGCGGVADTPYLGDEPRVRQVLVNLLANAVKFTRPGGRVAVTCALTDAPPAGGALEAGVPYLAFRVEDSGVGIPPDQRERIFEPFTQVQGGSTPYTRPTAGTGLGLAISRRLARLMGGDLTVESREGAGSTFTLWLPTPERRAAPRRAPAATPGPVARVPAAPPPPPAPEEAAGLVRIGRALADDAAAEVRAWVERLRADPGVPEAALCSDAELEDHTATFITDLAVALRTLGEALARPGADPAAVMRDGTAILATIAERHGGQRARLGWVESSVAREFALLAEVLGATARRLAAGDEAAARRAATVVARLVAHAERVSLGGFRLAGGRPRPRGA